MAEKAPPQTARTFNDNIHGLITIPGYAMSFVDTPEFQRLRCLAQLGTTSFVFPGATHKRFEHSLGTYHLAKEMVGHLRERQPDLVERRDEELISLAGLCHDLGHGPFSHCFESYARVVQPGWSHEDMSVKILERLITENGLAEEYSDDEVARIGHLIQGAHERVPALEAWKFEVVSNWRNSIDVDKFDYLVRDSYNVGPYFISRVGDTSRLLYGSRIIDGELCFNWKHRYELNSLLQQRYNMHKMVYTHKVAKAVELMISDAYLLADETLGLRKKINDPEPFLRLSDSLLERVEFGLEDGLAEAQALVRRIRRRDLYECVGSVLVNPSVWPKLSSVTSEDIARYSPAEAALSPDDLAVVTNRLDFPKTLHQPLEAVHFFTKEAPDVRCTANREHVSLLLPECFAEYQIRVFCKRPEVLNAAREAWAAWRDERVARREVSSPFRDPTQKRLEDFFSRVDEDPDMAKLSLEGSPVPPQPGPPKFE